MYSSEFAPDALHSVITYLARIRWNVRKLGVDIGHVAQMVERSHNRPSSERELGSQEQETMGRRSTDHVRDAICS